MILIREKLMNYKTIIQEIHEVQLQTFCPLERFVTKGTSILPKHKRGLYWIWTKLDFEELKNGGNNHKSEVPIKDLITQRMELNHICKLEKDGFRVIYNGIGGYKNNPKGFGLRERIMQELNSNDYRTGTLNIRNRYNTDTNWAVSFFDFDNDDNKAKFHFLNETNAYQNYASKLEKVWRLEFGHPILCRH